MFEECLDVYFGPFDVDQQINLTFMTISDTLHEPLTKKQDVSYHTVTLQAHVASSLWLKYFLFDQSRR